MIDTDYKFGGQDNKPMFIPAGDSIFEVIAVETGISAGGKTRGARTIKLKLNLEPSGVHCYETLIVAQATAWRIDTFCRCTGIAGEIGKTPEGMADGDGYKLIGLRGWATFSVEEYNGKKHNRVVVWITNKEKLQRKPWPSDFEREAAAAEEEDDKVPF